MSEASVQAGGSKSLHDWFPAYHPKDKGEVSELIKSGLVVLDANVLLDLYRYIPQARDELVAALRKLGDRLWVPHQAGLEFHERRFNAIGNQQRSFDDTISSLAQAKSQAVKSLEQLQATCSIRVEDMQGWIASLETAFSGVEAGIQEQRQRLDIDQDSAMSSDHVLAEIDALLEGKVGPPLAGEAMADLQKSAPARFEKKIPPGFEDADKSNGRALGDLILWEQIILEATSRDLPVLLLSREQKADWVRRRNEHVLGPHPLLVDEMKSRAGTSFHLIHPGSFLQHAKGALRVTVSPSTVEAVARKSAPVSDHRERNAAIIRRIVDKNTTLGADSSESLDILHQKMRTLAERQRILEVHADFLSRSLVEMERNPSDYPEHERDNVQRELDHCGMELHYLGRSMIEVNEEWKSLIDLLDSKVREADAPKRKFWGEGHWGHEPERLPRKSD